MIYFFMIVVAVLFVVSNLVLGILFLQADKDLMQRQAALREIQRRWRA